MSVTATYINNLRNKVQQQLDKMEYNCVTFEGVKNCSRSDIEGVDLLLESILNGTSYQLSPLDNEGKILAKYGLTGFFAN